MLLEKSIRKVRHEPSRYSCLFSCYSGSPVYECDEFEPRDSTVKGMWSRFKKKKKTVPVDTSHFMREEIVQSHKLQHKSITWSKPQQLQQQEQDGNNAHTSISTEPQQQLQTPRHPSLSQKYDTTGKIVTGTKTIHSIGSSEPRKSMTVNRHYQNTADLVRPLSVPKSVPENISDRLATDKSRTHTKRREQDGPLQLVGRLDPSAGIGVVVVTLAVMLIFGRVCAITFLCACFYIVRLLNADAMALAEEIKRKSSSVVEDVESEEYKKRVVLEGLLERNRRRPISVVPRSPTGALS